MASNLDLRGFINEPQQWAGLYHAADQLEKRNYRDNALALQQQAKRNAAGTFLQNYLDPKDYLSGTAYDPMILQGLQTAMQQGSALAASGADSPTLMMALGPMVNKLSTYAVNAKNINKNVDDQISKMKESGEIGYDFSKLKDEALRNAFYKTDAKTGQSMLDPDQADPTVNWIQKAIETSPEKVTNSVGFDTFADKAKMKTLADSVDEYDKFGNETKNKYNLKFQEYMVPERNTKGIVTGFVPKHDIATEQASPLLHTFIDENGKEKKAPVRLLDEGFFDSLPSGLINNIKGQVKKHLAEYELATGEKISMNSPKAKHVARALAYDELNRPQRNSGSIEHAGVDKPSNAMINLRVQQTHEFLQNVEDKAAAAARGREQVTGTKKFNPILAIGGAFNNDPEVLQQHVEKGGRKVYDLTGTFAGGGLQAGRGVDYEFKGIYFDPDKRSLLVDKESKDRLGNKVINSEEIPEEDVGKFFYRIGPANGVTVPQIKKFLTQIGYSNRKFASTDTISIQNDFNRRVEKVKNEKKWNKALQSPFTPKIDPQKPVGPLASRVWP